MSVYTHIYVHIYTYTYTHTYVCMYMMCIHTYMSDKTVGLRPKCRRCPVNLRGPQQLLQGISPGPPSSRRGGTRCVWMAVKAPQAHSWVTHPFPLTAALAHSEGRRGPLLLSPQDQWWEPSFSPGCWEVYNRPQCVLVLWLLAEEGRGFLL